MYHTRAWHTGYPGTLSLSLSLSLSLTPWFFVGCGFARERNKLIEKEGSTNKNKKDTRNDRAGLLNLNFSPLSRVTFLTFLSHDTHTNTLFYLLYLSVV